MKLRFVLSVGILAGFGLRATAADLAVTSLVAVPEVHAAPDPSWRPTAGEKVVFRCRWDKDYKAKSGSGRGRFLVDDTVLHNTNLPAAGFSISQSNSAIVWEAVPGTHRVRCELDFENTVVESDETNNRKEIVVNVANTMRAAGAGPQAAVAGAIIPGARSKSCKATIYTTVQLDRAQFSPTEGVPEANTAKMTLDLVSSAGLGNYVHCEYRSVGKDVKLVYTFACPNAHQGSANHLYACD